MTKKVTKICQCIIVTGVFFSIGLSVRAELKPLSPDFAEKVESGWLPPICARGESMPEPIIKTWAERRAGDKIRVLFITGRKPGMYECLSLAKAFDLDCDVITFWNNWQNTFNDKGLENLLRYYLGSKQYDVIAVSGVWLSDLPDDCEREIATLIQDKGVGLVYGMHGIFPRVPVLGGTPSQILDPLLPLKMDVSAYKKLTRKAVFTGNNILSRGQDFSQVRWMCNVDTSLRNGATALLKSENNQRVLAAVVTRGKGRIMAYNHGYNETSRSQPYFLPRALENYGGTSSLMDTVKQDGMGKFSRWMNGVESADQFYGWLGKSIIWAAKKEPELLLKTVKIENRNLKIRFNISIGIKRKCHIHVVIRSMYNSTQKTLDNSYTLIPGSDALTMRLPSTGMTGKHFIDVYLMDNNGAVLDWNSSSYKVQGRLKVDYKPDYTVYSPTDIINLKFKASGMRKGETITAFAELFDLDGRILARQTQKAVSPEGKRLDIPININLITTGIKSRLANARFLFKTSEESLELRDQFYIKQTPDWNQYHIMAYYGFINADPLNDVLINVLKKTGHDTIQIGYPSPTKSRLATETGLRNWASWVIARGSTPDRMKQLVGWLKDFSPVKYELQDEPELQYYPARIDRFSATANKNHFRNWLKKKYSILTNLNKIWGSEYSSWDNIIRPLWYDVLNSDNWSAWFDSREELDDFFIKKYVIASDAIKEASSGSVCSINPRSIGTFSGINLRNLAREIGSANLYNDYVRRESDMGYLQLGWRWFKPVETCIGYTWSTSPGANRITREAWDSARRGANICWFIPIYAESSPKTDFSYINGDFTLNAKGKAIEAVNKVLLSGPGDLAVNTEPFSDGIFVYYPRSLFYCNDLAFFKQDLLNNPWQDRTKLRGMSVWDNQVPNSFLPHLDALGYQYEYGDEQDLTAERLKNSRVVVLQNTICLSIEKMELLRSFVRNGGCVIAEAGTARRDGNGIIYAQTPQVFKDIFGVERIEPELSPIISKENIRIISDKTDDKEFSSGELGCIYRKGNAFFINFALPKSNSGINIVRKMMAAAGVKPTYQLENNWLEAGTKFNLIASMVVRKRGALTYLYLTGDGNKTDDSFSIKLPSTLFVYDVLADKNLGALDNIEGKINYGEARLFALSSSSLRLFEITTNKDKLLPGEWSRLDFKIATKNGKPGDRLVILKCNSEGKTSEYLPDIPRSVMLKNGKDTIQLFVPYNVLPGIFKLTAKDLTSGMESTIKLEIQEIRRDK